MKLTMRQFIYFINAIVIFFASVLIYYIYSQQKENLVKLISAQIKSTMIQSGYIFSKILNEQNDPYIIKPFLDRKVATTDIIKGFILTDGQKILVKSGNIENLYPEKKDIYLNIYEIDQKALENYTYFKKSFSFFVGDSKKTYYLFLITNKKYISELLEGLKVKFFIIWVVVVGMIFVILELLIKRVLIKPMDHLRLFADKKVNEKKELVIKEFENIQNTLDETFKELDSQINYLYDITVTDSLTGLGNRKYLYEYLYKKLKNHPKPFAVVLLDLDNFKDINDYYGHNVGDEVLIKVAEVLKKHTIGKDVAIRMGGDEFVLIIEDFETEDELKQKLNRILNALNKNWSDNGENIITTVSMGVSLYPENGNTLEELIKNADIALYEAKKRGKNKIVNFNDDLKYKINKMLQLKSKLKKALDNNEFEMYYQPKVDKNAKVVGCEALIRWFSDEGLISPEEFIPVAERSGFMNQLGEWIAEDVLKTRKEWDHKECLNSVSIAFNVSVEQMRSESFLHNFVKLLHHYKCQINKLEVEITESVFIENKQMARNIINEFHSLGLKVNLDDFGTGYSSLSFLQEFNVDVIKIDKSFVDNVLEETGKIYIKTMVDMAKNLGLETVAEGVETKEQFEVLKSIGVDYFQGYYFAKPLPKKEFEEFVKKNLSDVS